MKTIVEKVAPSISFRLIFFIVGAHCQLLGILVEDSQEGRGFGEGDRVHDEKGHVSLEVHRYLSFQLYVSFLAVVLSCVSRPVPNSILSTMYCG